ncbi:MAG TPA: 16S rRNA (guanine(966)-N(2))-methyltransferase RsmD [Thermodesulfovibrio thiophilus]|uniref:16S rRNA (guanine(966)-N(2))-methyltransferase RsmD n=1 Tax=Thermodesulfovibrio thiophilus TaxID=340095 RepID=UPI000417A952|nr:16S rRNA (guanine(966)-N(2))-methyltransferase RsmD [Thermodesulfovibrio thiophilus]HHW20245.1 16S rRNA (guanine(966)-N(2))-methyltransferase RsmD [Thermodesulfovibrio thiophilus]HOA82986.1 16S rRNA (guanine(966)-N(2))-methyltransferase RsmD [Thermodesulfovibrio thiophilus]HQA03514.1 16S rRNA (guanine(966)-N(2))-methyltransferase RsmD [Thermodesulfovibrio thiophilus]HQD36061.1 16S rRNA (guanine(966)-N(2))-methyltransferase RsmD [Thermodesulfovibrio thiophilus]
MKANSNIKKQTVRPTSAVVRKAIFDILQNIESKTFIDLYAGKGFVGMEALKKGADEVIFVEQDPVLCVFIKNSAQKKKLSDKAKIHNTDAVKFLQNCSAQFDIIFADPPYESGEIERIFKVLEKKDLLTEDGVLILQHHKNESLRENLKGVKIYKCYRYGDTLLTVYRRQE